MKGPLTQIEKAAIESLVQKGESKTSIKKFLERSSNSSVVDKYVDSLVETKQVAPKFDHKAVLSRLGDVGIRGDKARELIERALPHLSKTPNVEEVYNAAMSKIGPRELMITESANGVQHGVTVMTEAAARVDDRGDREAKGLTNDNTSRSTKNSVFRPKTGGSD